MEQKTQDIIDYFSLDAPKTVVELHKKAEVVAPAKTDGDATISLFELVLLVVVTVVIAGVAIPILL